MRMPLALRTIWIRLTSDKRRFGALCTLIGVGLLLWARLIIVSDLPKMAVAEPGVAEADPGARKAPRREARIVRVALDGEPGRDPFEIDPTHFPRPIDPTIEADDPSKSRGEADEDPVGVEAATTSRLRALVDRLVLEAVMPTASLALVDGRRVEEGGTVYAEAPGGQRIPFVVAEVRDRSIVLDHEGRRFELKMSGPSG